MSVMIYSNLKEVTDYKEVCRLIKEDGYATDPTYTQTGVRGLYIPGTTISRRGRGMRKLTKTWIH